MFKYIIKRLLYIIPVFIIITFFVFTLLALVIPGNPVATILGPNPHPNQVAELTERLGLDKPFFVRYSDYMLGLLRGDMGISYLSGKSVATEFNARMPNSLKLTLTSVFLTILVGIPMGIIAAVRQYHFIDKVSLVVSLIFASVPAFWLAMMAQLLFAVKLKVLPSMGLDSIQSYILPCITLSGTVLAGQVRMTRASMLDVLSQDYIRTGLSKGGTRFHVIVKHAIRNAMLPVINGIGGAITALISGAVIIETVFSIQGIGSMLINAVRTRDVPMIMGPVVFIALFVSVVNLLVDIIFAIIDPRVRQRFSNG